MADGSRLLRKINRAFLLQGLLITVAAACGVFFSKIVINEILIKNAILEENEYFWTHYQNNPNFSLPDTKNLTGFFDPDGLPDIIQSNLPTETGFYEYDDHGDGLVLYIDKQHQKKLYLLYYRGQVDTLVLYYGLFPLLTVLIILYLSLWLTYRFSRRTVSPIIQLAKQINQIDFNSNELNVDIDALSYHTDDEIKVLHDAILHLGERLNAFIARERQFTRDTSHELRSPLTVIRIAADMLLSEQELSKPAQNSIHRIKRAIDDMEQLTDVFLMLAREDDRVLTREMVTVNGLIDDLIDNAEIINRNKNNQIKFHADNQIMVWGSDMVISVLLGNLLRNALLYTENGSIDIRILKNRVIIEDSGQGIPQQQLQDIFKPFKRGDNVNASGYGIGLAIVKRLSERFHWPIEVSSEPGKGTCVTVIFSHSTIEPVQETQQ